MKHAGRMSGSAGASVEQSSTATPLTKEIEGKPSTADGPLPKPVSDAKELKKSSLKEQVLPTLQNYGEAEGHLEQLTQYSTDAGIYGFHPVNCGIYSETEALSLTPEEMACCTKCWWDGSSACWTSELQFANLTMSGHKLKLRGEAFTLTRRLFFGDGDQQSLIEARANNQGLVVAHSDYMMVLAFFDEDQSKPAGPLIAAVQRLAEDYRCQGF